MADTDDSGMPAPREDVTANIAILLFECRLGLETGTVGIKLMAGQTQIPELYRTHLSNYLQYLEQARDAFDALHDALAEALPIHGLHA